LGGISIIMTSKLGKYISVILVALLLFSTFTVDYAHASLNTVSATVSNQVSAATGVTYTFSMKPSVTTAIKQINLKFCTQAGTYSSTCTALTTAGFALPASNNVVLTGFGSNTLSSATGSTNVESAVITTPASETTATNHTIAISGITNPTYTTPQAFYVRIQTYSDTGTTLIDEADMAFALIPGVSMSANNLEYMAFTITAIGSGATLVNGSGQTTDAASTVNPTTVPFGIFQTGLNSNNVAHRVSVATNAQTGYSLTLVENQLLTSGNATIPDFGTTTDNSAGTAWTENTSYGFGVNAKGVSGNLDGSYGLTNFGTSTNNATTLYKKITAGTPITIESLGTAAPGNTVEVNYRVATQSTQPAGNYTNTLTYVATTNY